MMMMMMPCTVNGKLNAVGHWTEERHPHTTLAIIIHRYAFRVHYRSSALAGSFAGDALADVSRAGRDASSQHIFHVNVVYREIVAYSH